MVGGIDLCQGEATVSSFSVVKGQGLVGLPRLDPNFWDKYLPAIARNSTACCHIPLALRFSEQTLSQL